MVRREVIVVIVVLERGCMINWGKKHWMIDGIYIYNIVSHDFIDTLPKYQQNHVI